MPSPKPSLTETLTPYILTAILGLMGWIATNIAGIRESLAVAVTKVEDHDRRISNLETLFLHQPQP